MAPAQWIARATKGSAQDSVLAASGCFASARLKIPRYCKDPGMQRRKRRQFPSTRTGRAGKARTKGAVMSDEQVTCRHCGRSDQLLPLLDGRPSRVCRPCRRKQVNARRGHLGGDQYRQPRYAPKAQKYADQKAATARAIERAQREQIPMVEALRLEGVI